MKSYPLVSIVTINYKQSGVTNELLASLDKITYPSYEVIVVDNGSGGGDADKIDLSHRSVRLIRSSTNLGFAGGNNLGIKDARGKYILLLNNDTEVAPGFLEPMVELLEGNSSIGAVSPKIKFYYQPNTIQYAGFTAMNPFTLRMSAIGSHQVDTGEFDATRPTHFAHGCAMMVPRSVIDDVGLMPEMYFLYYEEHDWSKMILRAGYSIYYQPQSVVLHKESISVSKASPLKTYYINRNRILFMRRNLGLLHKGVSSVYLICVSMPKNTLSYLFKAQYQHLNAYWKAIFWNLSHKAHTQ